MTEQVFSESMRLAKFIANAGYCSRRQASRLIDQQGVTVNGVVADHICFVSDRDEVCVSGQLIKIERQRYYYVFNKPVGVDCRLLPDDPTSLVQYLPEDIRLILRQGLNRQIRKMAKQCGFKVIDLQRIRIANLHLEDLPYAQLKPVDKQQIIAN
jgi:16S rRNA U516 pseudouridylate synthase RsuA-like enzyme